VTDRKGERTDFRQLLPVYGAGFVTAFGAHAVAADLGGYTLGHHQGLFALGLILGIYDVAEILLKPLFGMVVDRCGAKGVMVGGLAAFGLASATFAASGDPHLLGAARFAQGAAAAAFSPAASVAVATFGGTTRTGRFFGGYGGAKGIGYLLGPIVGGALVVAGSYRLLFAVLGVVGLLAAIAVACMMPDVRSARGPRAGVGALVRHLTQPAFVQPTLLLAGGTAALAAGVGFLPVLGLRQHLSPLATGSLVSLLAATAAVVQPWAGRRLDQARLHAATGAAALVACAGGFALLLVLPTPAGMAVAAVTIGAGVAVVTPLGFARLAAGAPPGRIGQTMGAGEVGRELGDAGGPVLVGTFSTVTLRTGFFALAMALVTCAAVAVPKGSAHRVEGTPAPDH